MEGWGISGGGVRCSDQIVRTIRRAAAKGGTACPKPFVWALGASHARSVRRIANLPPDTLDEHVTIPAPFPPRLDPDRARTRRHLPMPGDPDVPPFAPRP